MCLQIVFCDSILFDVSQVIVAFSSKKNQWRKLPQIAWFHVFISKFDLGPPGLHITHVEITRRVGRGDV